MHGIVTNTYFNFVSNDGWIIMWTMIADILHQSVRKLKLIPQPRMLSWLIGAVYAVKEKHCRPPFKCTY